MSKFDLTSMSKKYGKDTVHKGIGGLKHVEGMSTGSLALDEATRCGGYPKGRYTEVYGPEHSGKTTLAIHAMAECQKAGGKTAFIDVEHALDFDYAQALGVDTDELYLVFPESGEQAFDIAIDLVKSAEFDLIVLDSVAALVPLAELEGEMTSQQVGAQARMIGKGVRKLTAEMHKTDTAFILINQLRMKVGVVYGSPETRPGGKALDYATSLMLEIRRGTAIKRGEEIIGHQTNVKVTKNKVGGMPGAKLSFNIMWGSGVDRTAEVLELAIQAAIVNKSGSWYNYGDTKLGQGTQKAIEALNTDVPMRLEIEEKLKRNQA